MTTRQPNSRNCFVCGMENPIGLHLAFYETAPGEVTAEFTAPEKFQGYPGVVHGGIVAAMLDEAAGRSQMGGHPPRFMFTARLDVCYRKTVPVGKPVRIVGRAGKSRERVAEATSAIYDVEGMLLAEAHAVMVNVPGGIANEMDLEALGWKVYPEEERDHEFLE